MSKERERDLKNDKIHQIDEFLKNVRCEAGGGR